MGFDIDCIIDIHSYPGEYFCPVCRTLVYPNEAFQAPCTHLYCRPCIVHIANGSKACPYDGYLVTESDSKPLAECNKALTEKVGKVKVHCLYFRSGCTWEGTLSDCASHFSGCSFGNSLVICNRCSIQIVHRQVHDHARICPGGYDGQQVVVSAEGSTKSVTTSTPVTTEANRTVAPLGAPVPQPQNPQNASAIQLPGQNANVPTPVVAPTAVPAPDQWYQQQYQQYVGFDPYQRQQYYPSQQQPFQHYQQHEMQVQGQYQSNAYFQAQGQAQPPGPQPLLLLQPLKRTNLTTQVSQQFQAQGQAQPPPQPQLQVLPQAQAELPAQGLIQANAPVQALPPNYQVNPQQVHPAMQPQTQIPLQGLPPPPHGLSSQPPQFHTQNQQVPQYLQSQGQLHYPQGSQAHLQPLIHPQTQAYVQSSSSNAQSQPQIELFQSHSQLPVFCSQTNQIAASSTLPQAPHPPVPPVSGHHSYQQPQKMQPGAPQQLSGPIHPVQVYSQVPQQPTPLQPPPSHGSFSQQQPSAPLQLPNQVPGIPHAPHQQFLTHGQQPTNPVQHHPVILTVQQQQHHPHNCAQQQQFSAPCQVQFHQQGNLPQQPPMQAQMQMRPPGPPQPQQSQNNVGIPMIPSQGIPPQSDPLPSGGSGAFGHSGPAQGDSTFNQNQNYENSVVFEQNTTVQDIKSPSKLRAEQGIEGDSLKEEAGMGQSGTFAKDADDYAKDGLMKFPSKQEKSHLVGFREPPNEGKSFGAGRVENETRKEEFHTSSDSVHLKQADRENLMKLPNPVGPSSRKFGAKTISANSGSSAKGHKLPPRSRGSRHERSKAQPSSIVGSQGPGNLPHPRQPVNSTEGSVPGNQGGPRKSSSSHPLKSQFGFQDAGRLRDVAMSSSLTKLHIEETNHFRVNGGAAYEPSIFGGRDADSKPLSKPVDREETRTFDHASRSLAKPRGHGYDAISKSDPGAAGSHSQVLPHHRFGGRHNMFGPGHKSGNHSITPFPYHSPGRDYLGSPSHGFAGPSSFPHGTLGFDSREAHRLGEGSSSSNNSADFVGNPFHDGRLPPLPGHLRRGDIDDPSNPRFGQHRVPGLLNDQIGGGDVFGPDGPGQSMKGKFSGPGYPTGHFNMGGTTRPHTLPDHGCAGDGTGNFPLPPFSESVRGDVPIFLHHGEPPMRDKYPYHGTSNAGQFPGVAEPLNQSREMKPVSNGWCRICEFDCETVEQLEIHSQTREHQNMAMDMVKYIKLQNKKKRRTVGGHMVPGRGRRTRKVCTVRRGNKP